MPAPKGHEKWGNPLNPKKYTPKGFWEKACEYFEWSDNNPWVKKEAVKSGENAGMLIEIPTERPYSIERLCLFAGITNQTFLNYESKEGYETFFEVTARVRMVIDSQHFEGGMTGSFNANITTRKLGLVDRQDIESGGKPIQKNIISFGGKEVEI